MKRLTILLGSAVAGLLLSLSPIGTTYASTPARLISVCMFDLCPNSDVALEACATGHSVHVARAKAKARHNKLCATL